MPLVVALQEVGMDEHIVVDEEAEEAAGSANPRVACVGGTSVAFVNDAQTEAGRRIVELGCGIVATVVDEDYLKGRTGISQLFQIG